MRTAAVRAVIIVALTLVQVMAAVLCSLAQVWLAFPLVLSTVASTVVATWGVLDVWVTRQVWVQRHGVVSEPSSVARGRTWDRMTHRHGAADPDFGPRPEPRSRPEPRPAPGAAPEGGPGSGDEDGYDGYRGKGRSEEPHGQARTAGPEAAR